MLKTAWLLSLLKRCIVPTRHCSPNARLQTSDSSSPKQDICASVRQSLAPAERHCDLQFVT